MERMAKITAVLSVLVFCGAVWAFSGSGSGIEIAPYVITDVFELQEMQDDLDAYYILGNDIDASATSSWNSGAGFLPIGGASFPFTGVLDGQGHTITGLYINRPSAEPIGLLGDIRSGAEIRHVGLAEPDVTGYASVGSLVGYNNNSTVFRCWSSGNVNGIESGGINSRVGGLVGMNTGGGLISQCYSTTNVTGHAWQNGGLTGYNGHGSIVIDCYARGNVSGNHKVGGLVGDNLVPEGGYVKRCYSTGKITGGGGGLIGYNWQGGVTYDSYWDKGTSGRTTSKGGTGKSTVEMMQEATFVGWDFDDIWDIVEGQTYPFLREPAELVGLEIVGPNEVAEDFQAQYQAIGHYDNGSTKDVTDSAKWLVEPNDFASIEDGVLSTESLNRLEEEVIIRAQYTEDSNSFEAEKAVTVFAICPSGSALGFDGVDDYVSVQPTTDFDFGTGDFTVTAWFKTDSTVIGPQIINFRHNDNNPHIELYVNGFVGPGSLGTHILTDSEAVRMEYAQAGINDSKWHNAAITLKNGVSNGYKLYLDGAEVAQDNLSCTLSNWDTITIGARILGVNQFSGTVDDVHIYNRALSAEEIRASIHTRLSGDEDGLVAYWDFDEGEGQFAYDLSINSNHGTLGSTPNPDDSDPEWVDSVPPVGICNYVAFDIKPGSCPNPLNLASKGILPAAILGTEDFDVSTIDPASIFLEGVPAIRSNYEDVAGPVWDINECECTEEGPDGYIDLTLKFRTQEIVGQLIDTPGGLAKGQVLELELDGVLLDDRAIVGSDCVVLVGNVPRWYEAQRWDGNEDGLINLIDLAMLANYWLESYDRE
ncbi:LamG-like jellyroll fold domain-containing protein [Planctomycetota bacterium]